MPDILIIGAGPAGALAGLLLARAGRSVTLIDQHHFPRDKVCGECLSPLAISVLKRANLLDRLHEADAALMTRFSLHSPNGRSTSLPLPYPMLGFSRWRLDHLILLQAQNAGATLRQHLRCEGIQQDPNDHSLHVHLRDLENNAFENATAKQILLADGRSAIPGPKPKATGDFGIKAHFAAIDGPRDAVELFGVQGHYGGLAPIEQGLWNAAFSVPQCRLNNCPDLDQLFAQITRENPTLIARMRNAKRMSDWLTTPLPRFRLRADWLAGAIPIGNAAAAIEPIGGEGMGLALRSAELAAKALVAGNQPTHLVKMFRSLWRMRRLACRMAALAVSRPTLCAAAAAILNSSPWIGRLPMRYTGKMDKNASQ